MRKQCANPEHYPDHANHKGSARLLPAKGPGLFAHLLGAPARYIVNAPLQRGEASQYRQSHELRPMPRVLPVTAALLPLRPKSIVEGCLHAGGQQQVSERIEQGSPLCRRKPRIG